jgi:hypothetical protein
MIWLAFLKSEPEPKLNMTSAPSRCKRVASFARSPFDFIPAMLWKSLSSGFVPAFSTAASSMQEA